MNVSPRTIRDIKKVTINEIIEILKKGDFTQKKLEGVLNGLKRNISNTLSGNVPGNVPGNLPGNVPGNVLGNASGNVPSNIPGNKLNNRNLNIILKKPITDFLRVNVKGDGSCFYHAVMRYLIETGKLDSVMKMLIIDDKYIKLNPINAEGKYWGVILRHTCVEKTKELILRLKQLQINLSKTNYKDFDLINEFIDTLTDYGVVGFTMGEYLNYTSGKENSNIRKYFDDAITDIENNYLREFSNFKLNGRSEWIDGYLMPFVSKILNKCIMVYTNVKGLKWETVGAENFNRLTPNECIFIGKFGSHYNALIPK